MEEQGHERRFQQAEMGPEPGKTPRADGGRRRRRMIVTAVVAVVLLVALLGYVASLPSVMRRYNGLAEYHKSWSGSAHAKTSCVSCHASPGLASQATFRVRMMGEMALSLLPSSTPSRAFSSPVDESCADCHIDLRTVSTSGDLRIPHRAHVEILEMACVDCHSFVVHRTNPEGNNKPTMEGCMSCHDGRTAKNACSACHDEKAAPASHRDGAWVLTHATVQNRAECEKCHGWTDNWCADCHSRRPRSHGTDWRELHGEQVKKRRNCEACHEADFCVRCHGVVPKANFDPALELAQ